MKWEILIIYGLQAKPFLALNHTYEFDDRVLENFKELKKFNLKVVTTGEINFDLKIKYHSLAKTFVVEDHDANTERKLNPSDIYQMQGAITFLLDTEVKGELKKEFELWKLGSLETTLDFEGKLKATSAIRVSRKIGVDKIRGPYLEDVLDFDGVKGSYFQKVVGKIGGERGLKHDTNPNNKIEPFTLFESKRTNLRKHYLFELFSKPSEK
ncbi:hypothetical protein [uncultured Maribacter sp.]|uniref:hypothetical protein n=1 Tax=uncultured Maribacter sp. TaxID=431308 RepID=UPI0026089ADD|nr:hypothetical protein [uncultured Maribacter sp.]